MSMVEHATPAPPHTAPQAAAEPVTGPAADDAPTPAALPEPNPNARLTNTIDIRQNRTALIMTGLFAAAVTCMMLALWLGHFSKTESVRGVVSASGGLSRLDAPKAGIISDIMVKQGQYVEIGTPIYALKVNGVTAGGETAVETDLRNLIKTRDNLILEVQRNEQFLERGREDIAAFKRDRAALNSALDEQQKTMEDGLARTRAQVQRIKDLVRQGYATRDILEARERAAFDLERQLIDVKMKKIEMQRQQTDKQREINNLLVDKLSQKVSNENQLNAIEGSIARMKTDASLVMQAQTAGFVLAITGKVGDSVAANQFVAAIGDPSAETVIVIDAPARAVGLIKVGQPAILKYDAFPFKTFGVQHGTITAISSSAIRSPETKDDIGLDPRPVERQSLYRVEIRPDSNEIEAYGEKQRLKIGSTLTAELIVERRRLIDWVLDPIRALQGRT